jgi:hypothetical protein
MKKSPTLALLVVLAHWIVAITHLFLAAQVLPSPNDQVSWLAIMLITSGHLIVSLALWRLGDRAAGLVSSIFFVAALSADLYEHFMHASQNNVLLLAPGRWTPWFDASVIVLLVLEILGCSLAIESLSGRLRATAA